MKMRLTDIACESLPDFLRYTGLLPRRIIIALTSTQKELEDMERIDIRFDQER